MNKNMNKKIVGIAALSCVVAIAGFVFGINYLTTPNEQVYRPGLVPPADPILQVAGGNQVSDTNEATMSVGYDVKSPAYLPPGYQVRTIVADKDVGQVTILASKFPVTPQTTDIDFTWKDVGVWITLSKVQPNFDKAKYLSTLTTNLGYKSVVINGEQGAVHGIIQQQQDGEIVHAPADIVFYKGNIQVYIHGFFSEAELQKMAESM